MRVSFYKKIKKAIAQFPLLTALLLVFLGMITVAIASVETTTDAEKQAALEDAIMRSALHCYSLEGAYPSDITYLEEHYNLAINREDYIVFYELFASNIAPDVTVIVRSVGSMGLGMIAGAGVSTSANVNANVAACAGTGTATSAGTGTATSAGTRTAIGASTSTAIGLAIATSTGGIA